MEHDYKYISSEILSRTLGLIALAELKGNNVARILICKKLSMEN